MEREIELPPIGPSQTIRVLAINGVRIDPIVLKAGETLTIGEADKLDPPPVIQNFVWIE